MIQAKLLLPRTIVPFQERVEYGKSDIFFFLAGPIRGAGDWQKKAILLIDSFVPTMEFKGKRKVYIVCPSRYTPQHEMYQYQAVGIPADMFSDSQRKITESQTNWERHYLEIASHMGCIIFWLPEEDKENPRKKEDGPYARDTYGELGEWRARAGLDPTMGIVVGGEKNFHGLGVIERNFRGMLGDDFCIQPTLEATIQKAISFVPHIE